MTGIVSYSPSNQEPWTIFLDLGGAVGWGKHGGYNVYYQTNIFVCKYIQSSSLCNKNIEYNLMNTNFKMLHQQVDIYAGKNKFALTIFK